jgi:ABC-type transporter MlaC component
MRRGILVFGAAILGLIFAAQASAQTALQALKQRQRVIEQAQAALARSPRDSTREAALRNAITEAYDFDRLARESIGRHWATMSPAQRDDYLQVFRALVQRSTVRKLQRYRAAGTQYGATSGSQQKTIITTVVTSTSGDRVAIQYKLHRINNRWWVWDTTIGLDTEISEYDVSTADNYRSAFNRIVRDKGIAGLITQLREKEQRGSDL